MKKLVLASQSPRRRELLKMLGLDFIVHPSVGEEVYIENVSPEETVMNIALGKAREVAALYPDDVVVGCDTLVWMDGEHMGKPKTADEARSMLRRLSGRIHHVYSGVAVIADGREQTDYEVTAVEFRELSDEEIDDYVATGEPMDKAGAYGIQGPAAVFVPRVDGDYFNVVGLPLCRLWNMLKDYQI